MDISTMNQDELNELKAAIGNREKELKIERGSAIRDKVKIGIHVKVQDIEWKVVAITEEHCTLSPIEGEGRRKHVFFEDIDEIIKEKK